VVQTKGASLFIRSWFLFVGFVFSAVVHAEQSTFLKNQGMLFFKIFFYDHNIEKKALRSDEIVIILIISKTKDKASEKLAIAAHSIFAEISQSTTIAKYAVIAKRIEIASAKDLRKKLETLYPAAIFISSGLDEQLKDILMLTRDKDILSITTSKEYVKKGVGVGIVPKGDKLIIYVNRFGAKKEDSLPGVAVLQLATIYEEEE